MFFYVIIVTILFMRYCHGAQVKLRLEPLHTVAYCVGGSRGMARRLCQNDSFSRRRFSFHGDESFSRRRISSPAIRFQGDDFLDHL